MDSASTPSLSNGAPPVPEAVSVPPPPVAAPVATVSTVFVPMAVPATMAAPATMAVPATPMAVATTNELASYAPLVASNTPTSSAPTHRCRDCGQLFRPREEDLHTAAFYRCVDCRDTALLRLTMQSCVLQ